mgnify:FL=1
MSLELNGQDLQMGSSVYSKSNEKVGILRFAMSIPTPPYQISQLLVDRVDGVEGGLLVSVDSIESISNNSIHLSISNEEFFELQPFVEAQWFSVHPPVARDHRTLGKSRTPRRQDRDRRPRYQPRPQNRNVM